MIEVGRAILNLEPIEKCTWNIYYTIPVFRSGDAPFVHGKNSNLQSATPLQRTRTLYDATKLCDSGFWEMSPDLIRSVVLRSSHETTQQLIKRTAACHRISVASLSEQSGQPAGPTARAYQRSVTSTATTMESVIAVLNA